MKYILIFFMIASLSFSQTGNSEEINSFDRSAISNFSKGSSQASDITLGILLSSPLLKDNIDKEKYILGGITTFALTEITKRVAKRSRPYTYNPDVSEEMKNKSDSKKSFYSGHTAMAFYSAAVMSKNSPLLVSIASYALASATGYLRYKGGMHFPSDILVGALVGYTIGKLTKSEKNLSLTPIGVTFNFKF